MTFSRIKRSLLHIRESSSKVIAKKSLFPRYFAVKMSYKL